MVRDCEVILEGDKRVGIRDLLVRMERAERFKIEEG